MKRILIIEDEQPAARKLREMILAVEPDAEIPEVIDTVREAVIWLKRNTADLIFLDIHLSDGNSFDIFSQVEVRTPVIFTTAYDEYALKAFKVNSIDYLLKPFTSEDIRRAIGKFNELFTPARRGTDLEDLVRMLNPGRQYQQRFLVSAGAMIKSITVEDIAYFFSTEKSSFICTHSDHRYATVQSLDKLEMLTDPAQFFRINRNFLVNYRSIKGMYSLSKSRIKLDLIPNAGEEVLVSFNKSADFRQWLGKLPE